MKTLSLNGESVMLLCPSKNLLVFDILYIEDIKPKRALFNNPQKSFNEIQSEIFEWPSDSVIGLYHVKSNCESINIEVNKILYSDEENLVNNTQVFGTDSGVLAIVDWNYVSVFLDLFDYDSFVDSLTSSAYSSLQYINKISDEIGNMFSIISTPGIGKGFEFEGSGRFYIENECFE